MEKTRTNKLKYNVTCNRCLPATSLAFDTNRVRCQRRQDAVVVKRLKLLEMEKMDKFSLSIKLYYVFYFKLFSTG